MSGRSTKGNEHKVYATDREYEQKIQQRAREAIVRIEQRHQSKQRRIQDLDELRATYRACGCWQAGIDILEQQMVLWGRVEHRENAALVTYYDQEIRRHQADTTQENWDETDRRTLGLAHAYSEARYAVRFQSIADAILILEARRQEIIERQGACNLYDRQKYIGEADGLREIIGQLQHGTEPYR